MFTSSGSTGGCGGNAKTIISPNTSFGDIIMFSTLSERTLITSQRPINQQIQIWSESSSVAKSKLKFAFTILSFRITLTPVMLWNFDFLQILLYILVNIVGKITQDFIQKATNITKIWSFFRLVFPALEHHIIG